ncbi:uncharacterized protein LOC127749680 isoform X2 [Frankliniella occidentalis]|nr:uncharacterized protein LOC127749680 isoform X2 [Frankliniella occidentalis]
MSVPEDNQQVLSGSLAKKELTVQESRKDLTGQMDVVPENNSVDNIVEEQQDTSSSCSGHSLLSETNEPFFQESESEDNGTGPEGYDPDDPDEPHNSESSGVEDSDSDEDDNDEDLFSFDNQSLDQRVVLINNPSIREILLLDLAQMIRHKFTYEALINGFENKNALFGRKFFPTSKKELWRVLGRKNSGIVYHAYCDKWGQYICKQQDRGLSAFCKNTKCARNKTPIEARKVKYFATISLRKQLNHLLNIPNIAQHLTFRETRMKHEDTGIEDVYDSENYKALQATGVLGCNDISGTLNTDGCKATKGATKETFPVFVRINEFPPHLRQKFMLFAAVYVDKEQPQMATLLKPVVKELNGLGRRGIKRPNVTGEEVETKLVVFCFCVDGKARGQILNMGTHASFDGCTYCLIHGVSFKVGLTSTMRWPALDHPLVPEYSDRTDDDMKACMVLADRSGQVVKGHKGGSALMLLDHMDLRKGNCVDDLHVIYECAAAHITDLILSEAPRKDERTSDEHLLNTIDTRMKMIKTPSKISRKPGSCSIRNRKKFKGTQWRDWLIHFALPCLEGLIVDEHMHLIEKLSRGAFLLSQDIILPEHIEEAETCFRDFLNLNEELYGLENTKLNLHTLSHAARCVKENGPLWCYSTFNFESWNNKIIKSVMSPAGAVQQIVVRHLVHLVLSAAVSSNEQFSPATRAQLTKTLQKKAKLVNVTKMGTDVYLAGRPDTRRTTQSEKQALEDSGFSNVNNVQEFDKILIRSTTYGVPKGEALSDNSVLYTYSDRFCSVSSVVKFKIEDGSEKCGLFVLCHRVGPLPFSYAKHISLLCNDQDQLTFIPPEDVRVPCVTSKVLGNTYVSPIPNPFEID